MTDPIHPPEHPSGPPPGGSPPPMGATSGTGCQGRACIRRAPIPYTGPASPTWR